ncbi:MAG: N-acetyltransferase [Firmicutes bacterium]|nr:N-acetyltransferase [Bacillota bacterium]
MRMNPPEQVSQEKITFDVSELEPLLAGVATELVPYEPTYLELKDGKQMLVREARKEEAPLILSYLKKMVDVERDFYDIVGARTYAEILGWMRNRIKDHYCLVGLIDGELAGLANGRMINSKINLSYHTMAFRRGGRIGAALYFAKCQYALEKLGQDEFWATYESYNGLKRWGIGMAQPSYPWPEVQHELGGAKVFYVRKDYWYRTVKKYLEDMIGTTLKTNPSQELIKANENMTVPAEIMV